MNHQQLKQALKKFKPYFPLTVQKLASQAWRAVELPVASALERRPLVDVRRVVWPAAEVADFEQGKMLGPAPGEVLVAVAHSLMSPGTERSQLLGLPGVVNYDEILAYYPGYAGSGTVIALGRGVTGFRVGQRVAGRIQHASRCAVPEPLLFQVPDLVPLDRAAFVELGIIVLQSIHKARIQPGESVLVLGQGLIGQLATRLSRLSGGAPVIAAARTDSKALQALGPGGADRFMTSAELERDGYEDGFDVVIEASGSADIVPFARSLARAGGRVIGLGTPQGGSSIPLGQQGARPGVTFSGAHISGMPQRDESAGRWTYRSEGRLFLDLLARQQIVLDDLITERTDPRQAGAVYEGLKNGSSRLIGMMFDWERV